MFSIGYLQYMNNDQIIQVIRSLNPEIFKSTKFFNIPSPMFPLDEVCRKTIIYCFLNKIENDKTEILRNFYVKNYLPKVNIPII